jgi:peptidyl-prolyl cis-trans isomerase C
MARHEGRTVAPQEEETFARKAIGEAIDRELLFKRGRELNIKIEPANIQREIDHIQERFPSRDMFLAALAFQNLDLEKLAESVEKQLLEDELVRREVASKVDVKDAAVENYYNQNRRRFVEPEKFSVSHVFASRIDPGSEGQADNPRDREKAARIIEALNTESRKKIDAALAKLRMGADFVKTVEEYSEDETSRNDGGALGEVALHETLPEFAAALARLKVGETSEVVQTEYGYHILKLTGKTPERQKPLAEAKSDILNILLKKAVEAEKEKYVAALKKNAAIKIFLQTRRVDG